MERGAESCLSSSSTCGNGRKRSPQPTTPRPPRNAPHGAQSGQEQGAKRPKPRNSLSIAADDDAASAKGASEKSKTRSGPGGRYQAGQRDRRKHKMPKQQEQQPTEEQQVPTKEQEAVMMLKCELEQAKWATLEARRFAAPPLAEPRENEDVD